MITNATQAIKICNKKNLLKSNYFCCLPFFLSLFNFTLSLLSEKASIITSFCYHEIQMANIPNKYIKAHKKKSRKENIDFFHY